ELDESPRVGAAAVHDAKDGTGEGDTPWHVETDAVPDRLPPERGVVSSPSADHEAEGWSPPGFERGQHEVRTTADWHHEISELPEERNRDAVEHRSGGCRRSDFGAHRPMPGTDSSTTSLRVVTQQRVVLAQELFNRFV